MVFSKIESLSPSSHTIQIRRSNSNSLSGARNNDRLSSADRLILPSRSGQTARLYFVNSAGSTIGSYRVALSSRSDRSTTCQVPCLFRLSGGNLTITWDSGSGSGCSRVSITVPRSSAGLNAAQAVGFSTPSKEAEQFEIPSIQAFNGGAPAPVVNQNSAIQALIEKGIIAGYQGGRIDPDRLVTREEFASMVSAANLYWQVPTTPRALEFDDVPETRWSYRAIALAVKTRFLSGYPEGIFKPTEPMPRQQVMVSLVGGLGLTGDLSALNAYSDANDVASWARPAVAAAIQTGILVDNSSTLKPRQPITRGEVATLIYQALQHQEDPKNLMTFENTEPDAEASSDLQTTIAPLTQEITLVHAENPDSIYGVQVNSLTSMISITAKPSDGGSEISNTIDIGQRYTYQELANGTYRGILSVISREDRNAIARAVQADLADWSPEAQALPASVYQNVINNRFLKQSPIRYTKTTVQSIPIHQVTIDLSDPDTILALGMGGGAFKETDANFTAEPFSRLVQRNSGAAVVATGTFYGSQRRELYGNTVSLGQYARYQGWEAAIDGKRGTALIIGEGNRPAMISSADITANNLQALWQKPMQDAWFALTAGPRLLKDGNFSFNPAAERLGQAFSDPNALAGRAAIGFSADKRTLYWVTPEVNVSLRQLAAIMQAIGCSEAMNLDGGGSRALAINGNIQVPSADLSHALVVYDTNRPAPPAIRNAWNQYQVGDRRPSVPVAPPVAPPSPPPAPPPPGNWNQAIASAANALYGFPSNVPHRDYPEEGNPPDGGDKACVWTTNIVLRKAGVPSFTDANGNPIHYVPTVEGILSKGRGVEITDRNLVRPGDLVISPAQEHIGICYKPGRVISNGSTPLKFIWDTDLTFDESFGSTATRFYRLVN